MSQKTAVLAMIFVVLASNILVNYPVNDWLTYGAFLYPLTFLVTELTNWFHGPSKAYRVVFVGFCFGVILSIIFAPFRIACASGLAFLIAQCFDVALFSRIRKSSWWVAPFIASILASIVDGTLFWGIAFWGTPLPWIQWAIGDLAVKLILDFFLLVPFRWAIRTQLKPINKTST